MKLIGLENIYKELKINNENYFIFTFHKNKIIFDVLFDIFKEPYELHFIQKNKHFHFCIKVERGFNINPILKSNVYSELCKVLNLKYDPNNKFSPHAFFDEFNKKFPKYFVRDKKERELLDFYIYDIEESNKLYFDGFIEWEKINNGKRVSPKNLEKTRILYPQHYEFCKRENVSIRYKSKE
jgi:hypothetical protein